jgi:hypothetical protein
MTTIEDSISIERHMATTASLRDSMGLAETGIGEAEGSAMLIWKEYLKEGALDRRSEVLTICLSVWIRSEN